MSGAVDRRVSCVHRHGHRHRHRAGSSWRRSSMKFTQAEGRRHRRFGGTGLGLSISEATGRAHGRRLTAAGTVGEGSTFTFAVVPRRRASSSPAPPHPALGRRGRRRPTRTGRVLVAEDVVDNRCCSRTERLAATIPSPTTAGRRCGAVRRGGSTWSDGRADAGHGRLEARAASARTSARPGRRARRWSR